MPTQSLEIVPELDLSNRSNWRTHQKDRYSAIQARLLIIKTAGSEARHGPVISAHSIAPNDTIELKRTREIVMSRVDSIASALKFSTTTRVCDQLSAKLASELGTSMVPLSVKLSSTMLTKSDYEITQVAENVLTTTTSHSIQQKEGAEHTIKLTGGTETRIAQLRRLYWPTRWDVYLHSFEYLELSFRKRWYWTDTRNTIEHFESGVLGWPLASITFYQPQPEPDVCYKPVDNPLENPEGFEVERLMAPMPRLAGQIDSKLLTFAKLAFPQTNAEKVESKQRSRVPKAFKKSSAGRGVAKKASPKKAAAKKAAPKAATKKPSTGKGAKKGVMAKNAARRASKSRR